jgi:hypothetical protein
MLRFHAAPLGNQTQYVAETATYRYAVRPRGLFPETNGWQLRVVDTDDVEHTEVVLTRTKREAQAVARAFDAAEITEVTSGALTKLLLAERKRS